MTWITDRAPLAALRERTRSIMTTHDDEAFLTAFDVNAPTALEAGRIRHEELRNLRPNESTTRVIAARLGCSIQTANRRLAELAEAGEVEFLTPEAGRFAREGQFSKELIVRRIPEGGTAVYGSVDRQGAGSAAGRPRAGPEPQGARRQESPHQPAGCD